MKIPKSLRGEAKGSLPIEVLLKHVGYLSSETVNVKTNNHMGTSVIVERWIFQNGVFEIEFSEQALEFLQAADDPRIEIVSLLFSEIEQE